MSVPSADLQYEFKVFTSQELQGHPCLLSLWPMVNAPSSPIRKESCNYHTEIATVSRHRKMSLVILAHTDCAACYSLPKTLHILLLLMLV